MLTPKKNSYKEFDSEKKFLRFENSPPPHNVSNGPSLTRQVWNLLKGGGGGASHPPTPPPGAAAGYASKIPNVSP